MQDWFDQHPWLTYAIIFVLLVYVYNNVFRVRKLPVIKNLIVYFLIAIGGFILLLFQLDLDLPIVYCLLVAFVLMQIVRIRYWLVNRKK